MIKEIHTSNTGGGQANCYVISFLKNNQQILVYSFFPEDGVDIFVRNVG
jgi:hypothetical protein